MRIIQSRNHVMATESIPAAYRPSNQARLERSRASNPAASERDAYLPEQGEVRWGNSRGDNGLAPRRLPQVQDRVLRTRMQNITGGAPTALPRARMSPLNVPIVPADVAGLGVIRSWGNIATQLRQVASQVVAQPQPQASQVVAQPQPQAPKTQAGWIQAWNNMRRRRNGMRPVQGTPMSWANTPVDSRLRPAMSTPLRRATAIPVPTVAQQVNWAPLTLSAGPQMGVRGLDGMDTPSLILAAGAALGVFMLIRNRH